LGLRLRVMFLFFFPFTRYDTQKDCTSSPSFPFNGSEPSSSSEDGQRAVVLRGPSSSSSTTATTAAAAAVPPPLHESWGSFAFGSGGGGGGGMLLRLCYQFDTEPYQAYPHLTATVKGVTRVVASAGDRWT
jgi:hypothetical protein